MTDIPALPFLVQYIIDERTFGYITVNAANAQVAAVTAKLQGMKGVVGIARIPYQSLNSINPIYAKRFCGQPVECMGKEQCDGVRAFCLFGEIKQILRLGPQKILRQRRGL